MEAIGIALTREDFGDIAWVLPPELQEKLWEYRRRMIDAKGIVAGSQAAQVTLELAEKALKDTIRAIVAGLDQVADQGVAVALNRVVKRNDETYSLAKTDAYPTRNIDDGLKYVAA